MEGHVESGARISRAWLLPAAAGLLCSAILTLAGPEPSIRFEHPRKLATVLGPTTIELQVEAEPAAVERVEVLVDGAPFRVLDAPPWELLWDAGEGSEGHELEAVLVLSDGRQFRANTQTSALRIQQIENVDLVNLYLVVRGAGGRYVTDLTARDFRIYEDGELQRVARFTTTHKPLRVGVVIDSSRSMSKEDRLEKSKAAALQFLDLLTDEDEGTVVSFSDTVDVLQGLSSDKSLLAGAIRNISLAKGTALYDSIWRTSDMLQGFNGRRVMVLLSDGQDQAYDGMGQGSLHTLEEALDSALRAEVMVFPIGLGQRLEKQPLLEWDYPGAKARTNKEQSLAGLLRYLADSTGGRAVMSKGSGQLRKSFEEIADDLRHQYSIAYSSTNDKRKGKWRTIRVETTGREFEIVTRKGYYGPRPEKIRRATNKR